MIKTVLFDFGGVLAEEGFREGVLAIAEKNGLDSEVFFTDVDSLIEKTGYLTGRSDETAFWNAVRAGTGIEEDDVALRREILGRFVLRPEMLSEVDSLRARGLVVAMLSDQTNWLDELDYAAALSRRFDRVFNSYRMHKSKRDASLFRDVCSELGVAPEDTLFIDDNVNHIKRAESQGLKTVHFTGIDDFKKQLRQHLSRGQDEAPTANDIGHSYSTRVKCKGDCMKVLAFNGSPRRGGNTELLMSEAVRGVQEQGGEVKTYNLSALNLKACMNCGHCDSAGRCIIKDDMQSIHDDIRSADRIIVASPIFFFSVSAQTKIMIDRCQAFWAEKYVHKRPIKPGAYGRKGLLLLVGGMKRNAKNVGFECSEATVRAFFRTVNVQEHVTLAYDHVDEKGAIARHATALSDAYEAGRRLASIDNQPPR